MISVDIIILNDYFTSVIIIDLYFDIFFSGNEFSCKWENLNHFLNPVFLLQKLFCITYLVSILTAVYMSRVSTDCLPLSLRVSVSVKR